MPAPVVLFVVGTRAELLTCASLLRVFQASPPESLPFRVRLLVTGQERTEVDQTLDYLNLSADEDLDVKAPHLSEAALSGRLVQDMEAAARHQSASAILVAGCSASAWAAGIAAYFRRIPLIFLGSGTFSLPEERPFPEWFHHQELIRLSQVHLCLDEPSADLVRQELSAPYASQSFEPQIAEVGWGGDEMLAHALANPPEVFESLIFASEPGAAGISQEDPTLSALRPGAPRVLIFIRRREHHADALSPLCHALDTLSQQFPDHEFIVAYSLQPYICDAFAAILPRRENVRGIAPLPHNAFIREMARSRLVITDSVSVMREAALLRRPLIAIGSFSIIESLTRLDLFEMDTVEMAQPELESSISAALTEPLPPPPPPMISATPTGRLSAQVILEWWKRKSGSSDQLAVNSEQ